MEVLKKQKILNKDKFWFVLSKVRLYLHSKKELEQINQHMQRDTNMHFFYFAMGAQDPRTISSACSSRELTHT